MSASDWDQRRLCPDGGCVGVLGDDGVCKSCGKAGGPVLAASDAPGEDDHDEDDDEDADDDDEYGDDGDDGYDEDDDEDADDDDEEEEDGDGAATTTAAGASGWAERALCPDGGCIGVIGESGTCNVCGRSAA